MLTFPTGKYRLLLYYPGHTFHFPRATGKRNSRPLTKFNQNPSSGSGEEVENVKVYVRTMTIHVAHLSLWLR